MKLTYNKIYTLIIILILLIVGTGMYFSSRAQAGRTTQDESASEESENSDLIVIGFSQPGAESAWRVALTESMRSAFSEENGYKLIYKDGQSKQDNQIRDIRTFIQQGVDYIILAPIVETGWDQVLEEARDAEIPVIICDRNVTVSNESLYRSFAGSNFREEGMTAVACVEKLLADKEKQEETEKASLMEQLSAAAADVDEDIQAGSIAGPESSEDTEKEDETAEEEGNSDASEAAETEEGEEIPAEDNTKDYFNIVHIQGTIGSSAQVGRTRALEEAVEEHSDWRIIAQACGEFTKGKAREEMTNILKEIDGRDIDMIYCENDEEAYGAMAALNEAGISYGVGGQVIIVSFDGTRDALGMCMSGLINIEVECNPLQGKYICNIVSQLEKGMNVPKIAYIDETYFTPDMLTQDFIDSRAY